MKVLTTLIVLLVNICLAQNYAKTSPCPNVFTYVTDSDTSDTWHGTLRLQTSVPLHGITVDIILDRKAATLGAYYFKDVSTVDYMEYRVEDKNYRLDPGKTLEMSIYVRFEKYSSQYIPNLKQVRFNGQNICVDIPTVAVQPIYPSNNRQNTATTRQTFQGDSQDDYNNNNRNNNNNFYNYDTSTQRNSADNSWNRQTPTTTTTVRSTTNDRRRNVYGNENSSNSNVSRNSSKSTTTIRPNSNSNNNGQGYDTYNQQQPRESSTSRSVASNSNNNQNQNGYDAYNSNNNNQRTTTTTRSPYQYDNDDYDRNNNQNNQNNRRTTSTTTKSPYYYETDEDDFGRNTQRSTARKTSTTNRDFVYERPTTTSSPSYFQGDLPFAHNNHNHDTSTHSILNIDDKNQCGTAIQKANPLIVHGEESYHGQFPWHAALYLSEIGSLKYICGGSLVSMSAIVTAAHCVTSPKSRRAINSDNLLVYLGKQNLQKWTGLEQDAKIAEILVNVDYNPYSFFGDIAILKLKDKLTRTNYVRPVCVWSFDDDLKNIVNKLGVVPGWGYNEEGIVSENLAHVSMPVVTHETCIWSNRDFFSKVTSDKSFCAGFRNGTSVCGGDSGGGMVFKQGNKYYLRGVVSISVALQNTLKCDTNNYVVFADAAKYSSWINQHI